jgi:uncharacterized protein
MKPAKKRSSIKNTASRSTLPSRSRNAIACIAQQIDRHVFGDLEKNMFDLTRRPIGDQKQCLRQLFCALCAVVFECSVQSRMAQQLSAKDRVIYNCHTHVFTAKQVPPRALPLGLVGALNNPQSAKFLSALLRLLNPILNVIFRNFGSNQQIGMLNRLAAFLELSDATTAAQVLERLSDQYPEFTRFVLLALDMDFMNAGEAREDYLQQLAELSALKTTAGDQVLPFVCADPRRPNIANLVQEHIEHKGFVGIKLYPALGFYPWDERFDEMYAWAQKHHVPIITHCSKGGIRMIGEGNPQRFTHPCAYQTVLEKFPDLKICLAHFGGSGEWSDYLLKRRRLPSDEQTWVQHVINLMYKHPTVFTDISYTASDREHLPMLKVLVNDPKLRERILFGSDYFVVRQEATEREFSIRLRGSVGEEDFFQMANTNPRTFLASNLFDPNVH